MSDMAYIMETQDPRELWLVDGDNKFRLSRDMYLLLASNGADLPPMHYINELLTENAKLRDENKLMRSMRDTWQENDAKLRELVADMYMRFHGVVIENWAYSSEDFRMYEQRMRELGIEVDE